MSGELAHRWAEGQYDRLPRLASDLVERRVVAIATAGNTPSAYAARAATTLIPVVFVIGDDPVKVGLVDSLNQPRGNGTDVTVLFGPLGLKRFELLSELVPSAATIAMLANPSNPITAQAIKEAQEATRILRQQLIVQSAGTENELEAAVASVAQQHAGGLVVDADPFFTTRRDQSDSSDGTLFATSDLLASRLRRGWRPDELWWQYRDRLSRGWYVPLPLLGRADEVIE